MPVGSSERRRLVAVLSSDVVGYSRLMGRDEAGTLAELKAQRCEILEPRATQHHGRTVKLVGDGALIGMGAIVLNGAVIGAGAVVGAGALVREGMIVEPDTLVVGSPARVVRRVDAELASRREATWRHYLKQAERHAQHAAEPRP